MTHEVDLVAVGGDALAYTVRCTYPDGGASSARPSPSSRDGRIMREVVLQAWDA